MLTDHDFALRSVYGDGAHSCAHCGARNTMLTEASARQASAAHALREGDLLCPTCDRGLHLDALAVEEMVLDRETASVDAAPPPWSSQWVPSDALAGVSL